MSLTPAFYRVFFRYYKLLLSLFLTFSFLQLYAGSIEEKSNEDDIFTDVTLNRDTLSKWDKEEILFKISSLVTYSNPYDYNDIHIQCLVVSPTGKTDTLDGFYLKKYVESANELVPYYQNPSCFAVRYAPVEEGLYHFKLSLKKNNIYYVSSDYSFFVEPQKRSHGFVRVNASNYHYFSFDDGAPFSVIGENLAWSEQTNISQRQAYRNWISKLSSAHANTIRVFMNNFGFSLEWQNQGTNNDYVYGGLKQYKQTTASNLDWLVDTCQKLGIKIILAFENFTEYNTNSSGNLWQYNPYNIYNGGMCPTASDFFSNPSAIDVYRNKIRYIIARYSYASSILGWELFNEVDMTDGYSNSPLSVIQWHSNIFSFIHSLDPNRHLQTTSFGSYINDDQIWSNALLDYTTVHLYDSAALYRKMADVVSYRDQKDFHKPTVFEEFGLFVNLYPGHNSVDFDSSGSSLHNGLLNALYTGTAGAGMHWEWQSFVDSLNLYSFFTKVRSLAYNLPLQQYYPLPYNYYTPQDRKENNSNLFIYPSGMDYAKSQDSIFNVNADGELFPITDSMRPSILGSWGSEDRMPPHFHVNYKVFGGFSLKIGNASPQYNPLMAVYVDDSLRLEKVPVSDSIYTIVVEPGSHDIKVDNLGDAPFTIAYYSLQNAWTQTRNAVDSNNYLVQPILGWGKIGAQNIKINGDGTFIPSADSLSSTLYPSWVEYSSPPTFYAYYLRPGSVSINLGNSVYEDGMNQRVQIFLDNYKIIDSPCVKNKTYTVAVAKGYHSVRYEMTGNWTTVKSYMFQGIGNPDLDLNDSSYIDLYPQASWGVVSDTSFYVDSLSGLLYPDLTHMNNILYGLGGNDNFRHPYNIKVRFTENSQLNLHTTSYYGGDPVIQVKLDHSTILWQGSVGPSADYTIPLSGIYGYHTISVDNIGSNGAWMQLQRLSITGLLPKSNGYVHHGILEPDSSDICIYPNFYDWNYSPSDTFNIIPSGSFIRPSADSLGNILFSSYLQGNNYARSKVFNVDYSSNGQFWITTKNIGDSIHLSRVTIYLDGNRVLNAIGDTSASFGIDVSAGSHQIAVKNEGEYAIYMNSIIFKNARNPFDQYILGDKDNRSMSGWLVSKYYNWQNIRNSNFFPKIDGYNIKIPKVSNGTKYIKFYDGQSLVPIYKFTCNVDNDTLNLPVPPFYKDVIFRMSDSEIIDETEVWNNAAENLNAVEAGKDLSSNTNNIKDFNTTFSNSNSLLVFPNPANGTYLHYTVPEKIITGKTIVYRIDGTLVKSEQLDNVSAGTSLLLNISSMVNGIYIIQCTGDGKKMSAKFIVNR